MPHNFKFWRIKEIIIQEKILVPTYMYGSNNCVLLFCSFVRAKKITKKFFDVS